MYAIQNNLSFTLLTRNITQVSLPIAETTLSLIKTKTNVKK